MSTFNLHTGDCLEALKGLPEGSVDAVVTDPPYGLSDHRATDVSDCLAAWLRNEPYRPNKRGFMGHSWDAWVPGPEVWKEAYRVLKPGGHIAVFAGSRTHDLMAIGLRLSGFEFRDTLMWIYSQGFPKSLNVNKAIAKMADTPNPEKDWAGWGTSLKPAFEPILLFRKPLQGTVAQNVLAHDTGALNIDGCRIPVDPVTDSTQLRTMVRGMRETNDGWGLSRTDGSAETVSVIRPEGRWPANVLLDGSDEVVNSFPHTTSGAMKAGTQRAAQKKPGSFCYGIIGGNITSKPIEKNSGSAARFFYCAKISRRDRHEGLVDPGPQFSHNATLRQIENTATLGNAHPTVKPTSLMQWLIRLTTPQGGLVLDPFMGSGSTGKAAILEGMRFTGIEQNPDWVKVARARIKYALKNRVPDTYTLFSEEVPS